MGTSNDLLSPSGDFLSTFPLVCQEASGRGSHQPEPGFELRPVILLSQQPLFVPTLSQKAARRLEGRAGPGLVEVALATGPRQAHAERGRQGLDHAYDEGQA